ncbi:MAG: amidohydrolase family protein, partial [Cyanobacteria bacterium P01_D01_bin.56]
MTTRYLIKQATVMPFTLQPDGALNVEPRVQDVLIVGDQIVEVADHIELGPEPMQIIDAHDQLLVPGFVNAHAHSVEILEKGRYEAMPLELWMLYSYPPLKGKHLSPRMCYLRTMLGALEVVKTGTTTLQDDLIELPYITPEIFEAVAQAYVDI